MREYSIKMVGAEGPWSMVEAENVYEAVATMANCATGRVGISISVNRDEDNEGEGTERFMPTDGSGRQWDVYAYGRTPWQKKYEHIA